MDHLGDRVVVQHSRKRFSNHGTETFKYALQLGRQEVGQKVFLIDFLQILASNVRQKVNNYRVIVSRAVIEVIRHEVYTAFFFLGRFKLYLFCHR